ncbi:MAG TPA: DUF6434 domain-containing protein [Gammaproteobacteria bacterium]|jgi:hypothetical protein|nr:DUF6434 domain-containing protein [Gammaproteobacteria bacterium]
MEQKPKLTQSISLDTFKNHYWLKVELIAFCKDNDLSATGSKQEIIHRIEIFITTGRKIKPAPNSSPGTRDSLQPITFDTPVVNYKNDAATRQFFVERIGQHFRFDAFLRQFSNKSNITKGLTYGDLVNGWLAEESKRNTPLYKSNISEQFEYNQFTRDFFANEKEKSRSDAINAWKLIKAVPGARTYANYKSILSESENHEKCNS